MLFTLLFVKTSKYKQYKKKEPISILHDCDIYKYYLI